MSNQNWEDKADELEVMLEDLKAYTADMKKQSGAVIADLKAQSGVIIKDMKTRSGSILDDMASRIRDEQSAPFRSRVFWCVAGAFLSGMIVAILALSFMRDTNENIDERMGRTEKYIQDMGKYVEDRMNEINATMKAIEQKK